MNNSEINVNIKFNNYFVILNNIHPIDINASECYNFIYKILQKHVKKENIK